MSPIKKQTPHLHAAKRRKPETGNGKTKDAEDQFAQDLISISRLSGGIAAVIIPVVRNLAAIAAKLTH